MCGRFEIHSPIEIIARIFQIDSISFGIKPSYNVAPIQDIAIVTNDGEKNHLASCKWGFLPSPAREEKAGYRMINARAETVHTNPSFRDAFQNRRCLVAADGFYEWLKQGKLKIPYYIRLKSGNPMGFAGLFNNWTSPDGEAICTCTIITTDADELLAPLHNRMPVILHEEDFRLWMNHGEHDKEVLLPLLKPFPSEELEAYRVTPKMNSFKYNSPENIMPA